MGIFDKLFGKEERPDPCVESNIEVSSVQNEEIPDALDLGWYWSENKSEYQMAKIEEKDRATHMYVIGATGSGKTKFLEFLIRQDIEKGNGFGVIDPHGDLVEEIKGFFAFRHKQGSEDISERLVLIDPTDPDYTVTFNPLEKMPNVSIPEQVNELVSAFRKIWSDSWGVRMEDLMRNSMIALGEAELTLAELQPFLTRRPVREVVLAKVTHPVAKEYFLRFDNMTDRGQAPWIEPVMNKINSFFSDERIRQMFASSTSSSFNLREIMDKKKILLIKLDKGRLKGAADLLGSLLMAKIQMAAFSRTDIPQSRRTPFYMYIDEFQNFASESFAVILSEARKYGLSLIMAHQTLSQISPELKSLILGNAGIQVYFRVNRQDANLLAKEAFQYSGFEVKTVKSLSPVYWSYAEEWEHKIEELQGLPPRSCYAKHKIEGGIIQFQTADIEPAPEILEMDEHEYRKFIKEIPFGSKYLVSRQKLLSLAGERQKLLPEAIESVKRKQVAYEGDSSKRSVPAKKTDKVIVQDEFDLSSEERHFLEYISRHPGMFVTQIYKTLQLSGYKGDRLKESLIEKSFVVQEETREGLKGRLAKVLRTTTKAAAVIRETPLAGKGGNNHKYIQKSIQEQAGLFGWTAVIEQKLPRSLESVDVSLKKGDISVAVEISSTTKAEQEIQNIRKCIDAGYDYVMAVCSDDKRLELLKKEFKKGFNLRERERIRVAHPSDVNNLLRNMDSPGIVSEKAIVSGQITKQKQLLNTKDAAALLGISRNTLYEWIVQNKVPFVKVGRLVKFRQEDLEAWLKKRSQVERRDFL